MDHQPAMAAAATRVNTINRFFAENSMMPLIMMHRHFLFANALLRVFIDLFFAYSRAKAVGLALVLALTRSVGGVELHSAGEIIDGCISGRLAQARFGIDQEGSRHHDALAGFETFDDLHTLYGPQPGLHLP